MPDHAEVAALVARFRETGTVVAIQPCTRGHINTTFFVSMSSGDRYVLQRINPYVFPAPLNVARNVGAVCAHLSGSGLVAELLAGAGGQPWITDEQGDVWRLSRFVEGRSLPFLTGLAEAESAGRAFARFQRGLADFEGFELYPAIEHFHDLRWRLSRFDEVLAAAPHPDRLNDVAAELEFVAARRSLAAAEISAGGRGVIHADCKVNNLIFDPRGPRVLAVVDLDTVMVGCRAWDFGDLVRSAATTGAEDDPDADVSLDVFRAIAKGFVHESGDLIDSTTRESLVTACRYMTFMLGVRFLIDYLEGDIYFRAAHPRHNLMRTRAQFGIVARMEHNEHELLRVVKEV